MLRPRIIPVLLLKKDHLVKTIKFSDEKYVGDPINAVKIFNEKHADELMIIDHTASQDKRKPNFALLEKISKQARMPLNYGGGISNVDDAVKLIKMGYEKISISSHLFKDSSILTKISKLVGSQSVAAVIDVKENLFQGYSVYKNNGKQKISSNLIELMLKYIDAGAGEIVINNISLDGTMKGYDFNLISKLYKSCSVPLTVMGGASSLQNIKELIQSHGNIGCAAGSLFVFKGKYRAVLVNYPNVEEKLNLFSNKSL